MQATGVGAILGGGDFLWSTGDGVYMGATF